MQEAPGRCPVRLAGPPEHSPWVEEKILPKKTHFRRDEVVVQQREPLPRAEELVLVPALQLRANPSSSGTQPSVRESCREASKSLANYKGLSGGWGMAVA